MLELKKFKLKNERDFNKCSVDIETIDIEC